MAASTSWCAVCHTRHADPKKCPGELLATGPERHGWRIKVLANHQTEIYGVLIAEAGDQWRARVLTYPNMLWSIPGGRGTIKFAAASAQEAEQQARDFIKEHCRKRGFKLLEEEETAVDSQPTADESTTRAALLGSEQARHLRSRVIRYGIDKADNVGMTSDLSLGGLFIATNKLLAEGESLKLLLSIESYTIPLSGKISWVRRKPQQGRPVGMGVQLQSPPNMYVRYIRLLSAGQDDGAYDG